jgi:hypothetical protein
MPLRSGGVDSNLFSPDGPGRAPTAGPAPGRDRDARRPRTTIADDFGAAHAFAPIACPRPAGGRLPALSTSGRSEDVLEEADPTLEHGLTARAMTSPAPNPFADAAAWP